MLPLKTADLRERLGDPSLVLVDVRSMTAYNGWRLQGEARSGHIPGAVAFPRAWLSGVEDAEVQRLLDAKGITHDRTIVVYGDGADDATALAPTLARLGYEDVRVYDAGFSNFGGPEEYEDSHLPGALYLDTNRLEDPADWNRRSATELRANLLALGISADTTVVLYGRDTIGEAKEKWAARRLGQVAATRAALILNYVGVRDVRVLDGGYDRWVLAGNPVETVPRYPQAVSSFGVDIPQRPELIVDIDEAKSILVAEDAVLVSVRSRREQIGRASGYSYVHRAGRIAGDIWGGGGADAYGFQHYRNVDNTMRAYPEIAARWQEAGVTPKKRVAFYCGTGWRASEAWFCAFLMGWEQIAVYDGGWLEWAKDPSNPIETGEQAGP